MTKFPAIFVNHGGGPMPLMGKQLKLTNHMRKVRRLFPREPSAIVVVSAHWEANPVRITSSPQPDMIFDYYNFPKETYEYKYPAKGSPELAHRIHDLLSKKGIQSEMDSKRGFDHGVFIPLLLMVPEANIPVVCLSLNSNLSPEQHVALGKALEPLRHDNILILGSGYTFHNLPAFFNPTENIVRASHAFNDWLKESMQNENVLDHLVQWDEAPGARVCHPREEHLLPLMVVAGAGGGEPGQMIYEENEQGEYAVSGYMFN